MPIIRDPRHQRLLARDFDIRQGFVAPELEPSIQPVTLVSDLEKRDIFGDAPYYRRAARLVQAVGDATHPPTVWLTNPAGSNMLLLVHQVTKVWADASSSTLLGVTNPPAPSTNSGAGGYFNRRTAGAPVGLVSTAVNQGPVAFTLPMVVWPAGALTLTGHFEPKSPIIIVPGNEALVLQGSAFATQLSCTFIWDEVPFEP